MIIWIKEINSQSLQFALRCLETAYVNFYRGYAKFPRFKSKKKKNSFTVPQFAKLENGRFAKHEALLSLAKGQFTRYNCT